MIKLIATDMDHTLLDDQSNLPPRFYETVAAVQNRGIEFVLASGRALSNIKDKVGDDLFNKITCLSDNGAIICRQGAIVHTNPITHSDYVSIIDTLSTLKDGIMIAISPTTYYVSRHSNFNHPLLTEFYENVVVLDDLRNVDDEIMKVSIFHPTQTHDFYHNVLKQTTETSPVQYVLSGAVWIDAMNRNANKGNALLSVLADLKIDPKDSIAFGDYHNDIPMLQCVGHAYAVANAEKDVKDVADEIIGSNDDHAVINKIRELLNIND